MELLEAESDRRAPLPGRAPPDETRSEHDEPLVASGACAPASKVDVGRYVLAERLDFQVCDQAEGGVVAPIEIWWWRHTRSKRPLSQADKRIISLLCAVLELLVLNGAIAARCEDRLPSHPQGGIA
jgi:hypothetical protein